MSRWLVVVRKTVGTDIEVEADTEEDACARAREAAPAIDWYGAEIGPFYDPDLGLDYSVSDAYRL